MSRNLYNILLVDDEVIERNAVKMVLRNAELPIAMIDDAATGREMLEKAGSCHADIIILDINMPGLSGLEALSMLRAGGSQAKVIISSAYDEFSYAVKALQEGAVDFLVKPVDDDVLIASVQKSIERLDEERIKEEQISKIGSYLKVRKESLVLDDDSDSAEIARKVSAYLETNYDKRIGLDEIARDCGYSKYHLSRIFKKATGKTVIDSLTQIRISKAKELLAITKESVKNIAFRTGFSDPAYFTWAFRKAEGVTPLQYRASALRK